MTGTTVPEPSAPCNAGLQAATSRAPCDHRGIFTLISLGSDAHAIGGVSCCSMATVRHDRESLEYCLMTLPMVKIRIVAVLKRSASPRHRTKPRSLASVAGLEQSRDPTIPSVLPRKRACAAPSVLARPRPCTCATESPVRDLQGRPSRCSSFSVQS